ncbi:hypothetical protein BH11ACT4_BH11ACT4_02570 [soil metagenome]
MRWDKLFDDLESQLEQELSAEELDVEAEEERMRLGRLALRDRLVALHEAEGRGSGYGIVVTLQTGIRLPVHPVTFGRDWFSADLLADAGPGARARAQCILPLAAIAGVGLSHEQAAASLAAVARDDGHPSLSSRLGLPFVLRDLCRRRRPVDIVLAQGELHGTLDRVGRDHLDLAVHERGVARRESAVREYRIVPLGAVQFMRL